MGKNIFWVVCSLGAGENQEFCVSCVEQRVGKSGRHIDPLALKRGLASLASDRVFDNHLAFSREGREPLAHVAMKVVPT